LFKIFWQYHSPVNKLEQIYNFSTVIVSFIKPSNQLELPDFTASGILLGFLGFEVCHDDHRKWVLALFKRIPLGAVIQKFGGVEFKGEVSSGRFEFVAVGSPFGAAVAEDGETSGRVVEEVENSQVVDQHSLGEVGFGFGLDFDVEQKKLGFATFAPNLDKLIGVTSVNFSIDRNLLEFFIQERDGFVPVDRFCSGRKKEGDGFREVLAKNIFPGAVLIGTSGRNYLEKYKTVKPVRRAMPA
jgi:hypothetical protein